MKNAMSKPCHVLVSVEPSSCTQKALFATPVVSLRVNPPTTTLPMDVDDPNFFTRLARGGSHTFEDRLRSAPRDDDGDGDNLPRSRADAPPVADEQEPETPLQQLIRHWMNERHAQDILPTEDDLLSRLLDHVRSQVSASCVSMRVLPLESSRRSTPTRYGGGCDAAQSETVQLLRSDPSSSEEEHFRIMLVQTEIERVKFIIRSYLRTRLFKARLCPIRMSSVRSSTR